MRGPLCDHGPRVRLVTGPNRPLRAGRRGGPRAARRPARRRPRGSCARRSSRASWRGTPSRRISGWAQWWPARTQTLRAAEDARRRRAGGRRRARTRRARRAAPRPGRRSSGPAPRRGARARTRSASASCAWTASTPSASSHSTAAPSPVASTYGDVPASNFHGSSFHVERSKSTERDHVAAGQERRHRLQQLAPAVRARRSPVGP